MQDSELDAMIDAMIDAGTQCLGIPIDPAWKAAIHANLAVTLRFASMVEAHPLPDDAEPASVFHA